jgi:RNA polymerase-binding transcription factor DksA
MEIERYRTKLNEELLLLEEQLESVGRINPDDPNDWEPMASELNADSAEDEERAMEIESFEAQGAIEMKLEERLNKVKAGIERIENGTFGFCETCKAAIEEKRLLANPAATTCMTHLND